VYQRPTPEKPTDWKQFATTWLQMLGANHVDALVRKPPSRDAFGAPWDQVHSREDTEGGLPVARRNLSG